MSPTDGTGEKVTPHSNAIRSMSPAELLAGLIIITQVLVMSIGIYVLVRVLMTVGPRDWDIKINEKRQ